VGTLQQERNHNENDRSHASATCATRLPVRTGDICSVSGPKRKGYGDARDEQATVGAEAVGATGALPQRIRPSDRR